MKSLRHILLAAALLVSAAVTLPLSLQASAQSISTTGQFVKRSGDTMTGTLRNTGQPSFLAYLSSTQSNVTGDGTNYTILFDTEVFDQASNYNPATGTFTAPVDGRYQFNVGVNLIATTATGMTLSVVTSNRTYRPVAMKPSNVSSAGGDAAIPGAILADMDAGDTVTVVVQASGTTKTASVFGNATLVTYFSGFLAN